MARIFQNPHPYSKTLDKKFWKYIFYILLFLAGMALAYFVTKNSNLFMAFVGYGVLLACLYLFKQLEISIDKNWSGEDGEDEICKILQTLSDDFVVFRNVPIRKHLDIDFILLGPIGIYAIEVKSHRWFYNNGLGNDFIGQTMTEAMDLKKYLIKSGVNVFVNAVLVFSRARVRFGFTPQRGVAVIGKKFLIPLLERGRRIEFDRIKAEEAIKKLYLIY